MGGADAVLAKAAEAFKQGDYRWVAELVSHVVFADPDNKEARLLEADALEQLGYQAESGPWRNFFLMGAQELRVGVLKPGGQSAGGVDTEVVESMGVDLLLDYVAIHLNGPRASGKIGRYDFVFTDVGETWRVNLENAVLQYSPTLPSTPAEAERRDRRQDHLRAGGAVRSDPGERRPGGRGRAVLAHGSVRSLV